MAYNKAREEKKWRIWKEAEEKKLRQLGVSEHTILFAHSLTTCFYIILLIYYIEM